MKVKEDIFRLHRIDAREINEVINDKIVDVTITSPPYYNMKDYGYKDQIGFGQKYETYLDDLKKVFLNIYNITKTTGSLWVIIDTFRDTEKIIPLPFDFSKKIEEVGWKLQDIIIWNKDKTVPWSRKGQTKNKFEYILLFSKSKKFKYYGDRVRIYNTKFLKKWWIRYPERYNPKGKALDEVWDYGIPIQGSWGNGYVKHFCPLPTDMIGNMIQLTSDEDDVILDPFAGTGSVLVQAAYMNRKYVGSELNREYINMFHNYFEKTFVKGSKNYELLKTGKYDQESFEKIILNLRALKYAKVMRYKLNKDLKSILQLIHVKISKDLPKEKHKLIKVNYDILINIAKTSLEDKSYMVALKKEIDHLISHPPLSKFGIEPNIVFHFDEKKILKSLKNKNVYSYTNNVTHKYEEKYNPDKKIEKFKIISPIKINLNEEDFE